MVAFAANSLLCRAALKMTAIDAASFTTIRLVAGALTLCLIVMVQRPGQATSTGWLPDGSWLSALALFAYAAGFSFAYLQLPAAVGALILFCVVQVTMISYGLWSGERLRASQVAGLVLAIGGLVALLLPGLSAPPLLGAALMAAAGIAWGVYSLRGRRFRDPTQATAGNFLRAVPFTFLLSLLMLGHTSLDPAGIVYAIASGAVTSGIGYAIWYAVLPSLSATTAASIQLSVPVIAALGGIVVLGETMTLRLALSSIAILGGIALVIAARRAK